MELIDVQMRMYFDMEKELSKSNFIQLFDTDYLEINHAYNETDQKEIGFFIKKNATFKFTYTDRVIEVKIDKLEVDHPNRPISECTVGLAVIFRL